MAINCFFLFDWEERSNEKVIQTQNLGFSVKKQEFMIIALWQNNVEKRKAKIRE